MSIASDEPEAVEDRVDIEAAEASIAEVGEDVTLDQMPEELTPEPASDAPVVKKGRGKARKAAVEEVEVVVEAGPIGSAYEAPVEFQGHSAYNPADVQHVQ